MSIELSVLAWGCVLGVVQIFVAAQLARRQYGLDWALSSREATLPPPTPVVGRMKRAQANFFETFPIAAAAILIVEAGGLNSFWTAAGAILWLAARLLYLPVYAMGITGWRSLLFASSIVGIGLMLWPALAGSFSWAW
ncbi:MAPEG family protein [Aestuariivirga sp. YIM B02566]|uniref:MAPEG family protein n=1 Tax=Taklimakanibacter albus TaxID=2800327 RepID=A0ACC5RFX4_9HYPH|nr:MAPEG family protein [Aestuariivirga sp. YIM B02566]MBK1871488.1 MAPEG family protein [Aestuariivirga sp. YIM B02566]